MMIALGFLPDSKSTEKMESGTQKRFSLTHWVCKIWSAAQNLV